MFDLYLIALLTLVATEYGIQTRKAAMANLVGKWLWRRTLLRALVWVATWQISGGSPEWAQLSLLGVAVALGELCALILRRAIRADIMRGHPHGTPLSHLMPFIFLLLLPLFVAILVAIIGEGVPLLYLPFGVAEIGTALALIGLLCWATLFTVSVIDLVRPEEVKDEITPSIGAGEIIGLLERVLLFLIIRGGGLEAVGLVVAAKSAARFPRFKDEAFAEYFLIGTLCSVGLAAISGLLLGSP
jgi:hypothetical protein